MFTSDNNAALVADTIARPSPSCGRLSWLNCKLSTAR